MLAHSSLIRKLRKSSRWVAQAIAEGKIKVSVADLDRLIRLEEFLREEQESKGMEIILHLTDEHGTPIKDPAKTGE